MIEVKAPNQIDIRTKFTIFLGGSIEMGKAENWQERLKQDLSSYSDALVLLNPRRDDWDSSWAQDPTPGTDFYNQVCWETAMQDSMSDLIVYYFAPGTVSPITLLELGCFGSQSPNDVIVCCPREYFRYGNVAMFCGHQHIRMVETYDAFLHVIKQRLKDRSVY